MLWVSSAALARLSKVAGRLLEPGAELRERIAGVRPREPILSPIRRIR
jgi:hypothetical protein